MHTAGLGHQIRGPITAKNDLNGSPKSAKICTIQRKDKLLCRLQEEWGRMIPTAMLLASLVTIKAMLSKQPRQTRWTLALNKHTMAWTKWTHTATNRLTANNISNNHMVRNSMEVVRSLGLVITINMDNNEKYRWDTTHKDKWLKKKKLQKKYLSADFHGIYLNKTLLCFSENLEKCGV